MAKSGNNPISLDITFSYAQAIQKLIAAVKATGKDIDVSFIYKNKVNQIARDLKDIAKIPIELQYKQVLRSFGSALKQSAKGIPVELDTKAAISDLVNALSNAPIEIKVQYDQALTQLKTDVAKALADLKVSSLSVTTGGGAKLIKEIQTLLNDPEKGLQAFNRQSRPNKAQLTAYVGKLVKEFNKLLEDKQYAIKFNPEIADLSKAIEGRLPELEAAIKVPIDIDTTTLQSLSDMVDTFIRTIETAINSVAFDNFTDGLKALVTDFSDSFTEMDTKTRESVATILAELDKINSFTFNIKEVDEAVRTSLRNLVDAINDPAFSDPDPAIVLFFERLGDAIDTYQNGNHDTTDLIRFATAIADLGTNMEVVAKQADALLNGSFGDLLKVVSSVSSDRLKELRDAITDVINAMSGTTSFNDLIDELKKIVTAVDSLTTSLSPLFKSITDSIADAVDKLNKAKSSGSGSGDSGGDNGSGSGDNSGSGESPHRKEQLDLDLKFDKNEAFQKLIEGLKQKLDLIDMSALEVDGTSTIEDIKQQIQMWVERKNEFDEAYKAIVEDSSLSDVEKQDKIDELCNDIQVFMDNAVQSTQAVENLGVATSKFIKKASGLAEASDGFEKFRLLITQMSQSGLDVGSMPKKIMFTLGGVEGVLSAFDTIANQSIPNFVRASDEAIEQVCNSFGVGMDQLVQNADGSFTTVGAKMKELAEEQSAEYFKLLKEGKSEAEATEIAGKRFQTKKIEAFEGKVFEKDGTTKVDTTQFIGNLRQQTGRQVGDTLKNIITQSGGKAGLSGGQAVAKGLMRGFGALKTQIGSFLATPWGLALMIMFKAWKTFQEVHGDQIKRERELWTSNAKFITDTRVRMIKQTAELEKEQLKSVSDLEVQRLRNTQELTKLKMTMYSWEINAQEKLYAIELKRIEGQKQNELLTKKMQNVTTNNNAILEHNREISKGKTESTYMDQWWRFGFNTAKDKYGNVENNDVLKLVWQRAWGADSRGGLQTGQSGADYLKMVKETGAQTREVNNQWFQSEFDKINASNENTIAELVSLQSGKLSEEDRVIVEKMISAIEENTKALAESSESAGFIHTFSDFNNVREAVNARSIRYDENLQALITQDAKGMDIVVGRGKNQEEAIENAEKEGKFESYALEARNLKRKQDNLMDKAKEAQSPEKKAEIERIKRNQMIVEAGLQRIETLTNQEKELRTKLADDLAKAHSNMAAWNESNASKMVAQETISRRMRHEMELRDPRLLNNPDAKLALQMQHDYEDTYANAKNTVVVQQDWDKWLQQAVTKDKEKFDLEQSQISARHKLEMDNIQSVAKVQIDNLNIQRDLIKKMMNHAVSQFKLAVDPYGRNRYDTMKEMSSISIDASYDKRIAALEKSYNESNQVWEKEQKEQIQTKVEIQEDKDFEDKWKLEEELLEQKQELEMALLEAEFKRRLEQVKIEVKYRHDLEEQYRKMREADEKGWLEQGDFTKKQLEQAGIDTSKYNFQDGKLVFDDNFTRSSFLASLSKEQKESLTANRQAEYSTMIDEVKKKLGTVGINADDEVKKAKEAALSDTTTDAKVKAAIEKEKKGELLDVSESALLKNFENKTILSVAQANRDTFKEKRQQNDDEVEKLKQQRADIKANVFKNKGIDEDQWRKDQARLRQLLVMDTKNVKGNKEIIELADRMGLSEEQKGAIYTMAGASEGVRENAKSQGKYGGLIEYWQLSSESKTKQNEFAGALNEFVNGLVPMSDEERAKISEIDEQIKNSELQATQNGIEDRTFDEMLDSLASMGDAEAVAIMEQSKLQDENAKIEHGYLEAIAKSVENDETGDIKKQLEQLNNEQKKQIEKQKMDADRRMERLKTTEQARFDVAKAEREDAKKEQLDTLEARKEMKKSLADAMIENKKRQDQFNAGIVKREADYRQTQRSNQTNLAIDMMQAKTGTDRLKALAKYNAESDYNAQSTAMDERHKAEMEALMRRGNFTEEEKAQLEARQQDEKSSLDESKRYADAVRDAMGDVGGIRSLVTEGTGQTSGLTDTWERIQAAAFGHVEDPAADAVINLDRAQALQHASLMSLLSQQLPSIAQGVNSMNNQAITNNYNQTVNKGTPPTVGGWS